MKESYCHSCTNCTVGRQQWFSAWSEDHEILCLNLCLEENGYRTHFFALEVRCLGFCPHSLLHCFEALGLPKSIARQIKMEASRTALHCSYILFLRRGIPTWQLGRSFKRFVEFCLWLFVFFCRPTTVDLHEYCNCRNFRMRVNFVYFILLAESTKISSIQKPCSYTKICDTALEVRKFIACESLQTLECEIFTHMKIFAITVLPFTSIV